MFSIANNGGMNGKWILGFVVASILQAWLPVGAFAHEFETGHIERTIDVIVRDRKVQVKYAIGLSDTTILDWLVTEQLIESSEEERFRKCIAELENESVNEGLEEVQSSDKSVPKRQPKPVPEPREKSATATTPRAKASESNVQTEPLQFQTELLTLLQEKLSEGILENLELKCDEVLLEKAEIAASNSARHHVSLEIAFSVELPIAENNELSIVDRNFLDLKLPAERNEPTNGLKGEKSEKEQAVDSHELKYFGNIRLACRVKGKAVQLNSNVAPVLARVKPVDVGPLSRDQRVEAATIRTKLAFVGNGGR